jgi:hypothetical protein
VFLLSAASITAATAASIITAIAAPAVGVTAFAFLSIRSSPCVQVATVSSMLNSQFAFEGARLLVEAAMMFLHGAGELTRDLFRTLQFLSNTTSLALFALSVQALVLAFVMQLLLEVSLPLMADLAGFSLHKLVESDLLLVAPSRELAQILSNKLIAREFFEFGGFLLNLLVIDGRTLVDTFTVTSVITSELMFYFT